LTRSVTKKVKSDPVMMPLQLRAENDAPSVRELRLNNLAPGAVHLLNHLRMISLRCRAAAQTDLYEACRVLSTCPDVARNAHAETLMKCLAQALGKLPVLFRPGVEQVSFDESWLLGTTAAVARKDWDSFQFLLASRVPLNVRRNLGSLIIGVSESFHQV
jgi:hypothetical protein